MNSNLGLFISSCWSVSFEIHQMLSRVFWQDLLVTRGHGRFRGFTSCGASATLSSSQFPRFDHENYEVWCSDRVMHDLFGISSTPTSMSSRRIGCITDEIARQLRPSIQLCRWILCSIWSLRKVPIKNTWDRGHEKLCSKQWWKPMREPANGRRWICGEVCIQGGAPG